MAIPVKLPVFEGPLDLLLHLIDKNKIDIYDIPIAQVTDQYLDYIRRMNRQDMNVTSEFMVMAATLIDIKCRMLLPREYKYISGELRERMEQAGRIFFHRQDLPQSVLAYRPPVDTSDLLKDVTLESLHRIFRDVLRRQEDKIDPIRSRFGHIEKEEVSLPDKMTFVERYAVEKRKFSFRNLLEGQKSRMQIVVTFLAILELMKTGKIRISQQKIFGEIQIESLESEDTVVVPYTEEVSADGI